MDVIIVCHTEFGFVKERRLVFDNSTKQGVGEGIRNLLDIAKKYNAKITFALMPEVVEYIPKDLEHEVGLHVHAQGLSPYLSEYSFQEQSSMIRMGKEKLRQLLGKEPKVFVAGRWALNNDTIRALVENGFTHDCSALPRSRASSYWRKLPRTALPYHPEAADYQKRGSLPLLIVPVSQGLLGASANPEDARSFGLPWLKACFEEYYTQKAPVFHIALHSIAMTDPFYINVMDSLLSFVSQHQNISFKFASEIQESPMGKIPGTVLPYLGTVKAVLSKSKTLRMLYAQSQFLFSLFRHDAGNAKKMKLFLRVMRNTMVGYPRLNNVYNTSLEAVQNGIPGAFVECGVWKGGAAGVMGYMAEKEGKNRQVWLFDSFEGLPEPGPKDGKLAESYAAGRASSQLSSIGQCVGPLEDVRKLFLSTLKLKSDSVHIEKGWFQDTLPGARNRVGPIAVLRLDADWYESTKVALENLYDNVVPGGYVIIDDYGHWEGCRKAVHEFLDKRNIRVDIRHIDYTGVYFKKP